MLDLIIGRAAHGKSEELLQRLKADAGRGQSVWLLVPEQFSFETERHILTLLGDEQASKVQVISFSGLFDRLCRETGGTARELLSDADKIVFMSRALKSLKDQLSHWNRYIHSSRFAHRVVDMIGECKIMALTTDDLTRTAEVLEDGLLKTKLCSLALAWKAYDAYIGQKYLDPADQLTRLWQMITERKFFADQTVYIDGFKGFTGQQYRILETVLVQAKRVCMTALCDTPEGDDINLFYNSRRMINRLIQLCKKHAVTVAPIKVLTQSYFETAEMTLIEQLLSSGESASCVSKTDRVWFCQAADKKEQAACAARFIRQKVRTENLRYRDFVVIARDASAYQDAVLHAFAQNNIPLFADHRLPLTVSPLYRFIRYACKLTDHLDSDALLGLLKTGLMDGFDEAQVDLLENYVFIWNIQSGGWLKEWDMSPNGFAVEDHLTDEQKAEQSRVLSQINEIRKRVTAPVLRFQKAFHGHASELSTAVVSLLEDCHTGRCMSRLIQELPDSVSMEDKDSFRQSYGAIMDVLDSLVRCFSDEPLVKEEWMDAFRLSCEMTTIGRIPQYVDEVTFGSADRIRPFRPKYAVILGADQGIFPAYPENNSLLCNADRMRLIEAGLDIRSKTVDQSVEERLLVYTAVCCASKGVCICCGDGSDEQAVPSAFVGQLRSHFSQAIHLSGNDPVSLDNLPETPQCALEVLTRQTGVNGAVTALREAVLSMEETAAEYGRLKSGADQSMPSLSAKTAEELYGRHIATSASRFNVFHRCHFRYFCRYGLKVEPLRAADLNTLQRGTLVHHLLEQFCNRYLLVAEGQTEPPIPLETLTRGKTKAILDDLTDGYLDRIQGGRSILDARMLFLLEKIKEGALDVVWQMVGEFSQSEFVPRHCELGIGPGEALGRVEFPFTDGSVSLYGSIDRLDSWNGYVRIVDYKTGSMDFKLPDLLCGQNMQMLIYLYAVIRGGQTPYRTAKPAGILYMHSFKNINHEKMTMNGLLCDNERVLTAMEREQKGEFIPKYSKKSRSFIAEEDFNTVFDYIESRMTAMGRALLDGDIAIDPVDGSDKNACAYCDYADICGIEDKPHRQNLGPTDTPEILEAMRKGEQS